jgi:hypothetical protein
MDYIPIHPVPIRGRLQSSLTRGGERWPRRPGAKTNTRSAAAQAARSRCASRASREPIDGSAVPRGRPPGAARGSVTVERLCAPTRGRSLKGPSTGGLAEQAYKHRARNAGEPALRGKYNACVLTTFFVHRVMGRSAPRRSAHPRTFEGLEWAIGRRAHPGAGQTIRAAELWLFSPPHKGEGEESNAIIAIRS